jgi:hypothetical protein
MGVAIAHLTPRVVAGTAEPATIRARGAGRLGALLAVVEGVGGCVSLIIISVVVGLTVHSSEHVVWFFEQGFGILEAFTLRVVPI